MSRVRFRTVTNLYVGLDGFYATVPLSKGYRLRMDFELCEPYDGNRWPVVVAMFAYQGRYSLRRACESDGLATGPGGLAVVGVALDLLERAEAEACRRWPDRKLRMELAGANETLYRLYRRVLIPRGYRATDWDYELVRDLT